MTRGDFDYEAGGTGYSTQRRADPRIEAAVHAALGNARTIVNVGAGAGSYEPTDRRVVAVEPSASMRSQRTPDAAPVIEAVASALPFATDSLDAAMATITIHHWPDTYLGLREMRRVARDRVVILTFDGDALDRQWLADYVPEFVDVERRRYPSIDSVCAELGSDCSVTELAVAVDCTDGFTEAYYAQPEKFLDPAVLASQSAWGFIDSDVIDRFVATLRADLDSGRWDERLGHLRTQPEFLGALRLIVANLPG